MCTCSPGFRVAADGRACAGKSDMSTREGGGLHLNLKSRVTTFSLPSVKYGGRIEMQI